MDGSRGKPLVDQFRLLCAIYRELYTILVRDLSRNPSECLTVMGLWLWFERRGFPNVVSKIVTLTPVMIDQLADEAITCLRVINNQLPFSFEARQVLLTCSLLETDVFVQYLEENWAAIFHEVHRLVSNVCIPTLSDLMERPWNGGFGGNPTAVRQPVPDRQALPTIENILAEDLSRLNIGEAAQGNMMAGLARTMFAVFSEGSPVPEGEIRQFFTMLFGGCIESVHMHEVGPGEQPLYARIAFLRPSFVQIILNGNATARFVINSKDVWLMQYLPPSHGRMLLPCRCPGEGPSTCHHRRP